MAETKTDSTAILTQLQTALSEAKSKKASFDKLTAQANSAGNEYHDAVNKAGELKKQLNEALDNELNAAGVTQNDARVTVSS